MVLSEHINGVQLILETDTKIDNLSQLPLEHQAVIEGVVTRMQQRINTDRDRGVLEEIRVVPTSYRNNEGVLVGGHYTHREHDQTQHIIQRRITIYGGSIIEQCREVMIGEGLDWNPSTIQKPGYQFIRTMTEQTLGHEIGHYAQFHPQYFQGDLGSKHANEAWAKQFEVN